MSLRQSGAVKAVLKTIVKAEPNTWHELESVLANHRPTSDVTAIYGASVHELLDAITVGELLDVITDLKK